jgi:hypothetical protein
MKIKKDVIAKNYNFNLRDFYSEEEINKMLKKLGTLEEFSDIKNESYLSDWLFHYYDDLFCLNNVPTLEEVQKLIDGTYDWIMEMED